MKQLLMPASVVVRTSNCFSLRHFAECIKELFKGELHVKWLFFLIQPITSLVCEILTTTLVHVVISLVSYYINEDGSFGFLHSVSQKPLRFQPVQLNHATWTSQFNTDYLIVNLQPTALLFQLEDRLGVKPFWSHFFKFAVWVFRRNFRAVLPY